MPTYEKPQSPIYSKTNDAYLYPLTTVDQVIMEDGSRLNSVGMLVVDNTDVVDGEANPINADTLGGKTEGELSVADSAKLGGYSIDSLINKIYPIGSIYMSTSEVSPEILFGGTWEQIEDTFLLASGSSYAAGSTGGEAVHTLTVDEMPKHLHYYNSYQLGYPSTHSNDENYKTPVTNIGRSHEEDTNTPETHSNYTGGSQPHNNMPPYLAVYVWQRTA